MDDTKGWKIERGIRLDLVAMMVVQAIGFIWLLSSMDTRLSVVEFNVSKLQEQVLNIPQRMSSVETKADMTISLVQEIRDKMFSIRREK